MFIAVLALLSAAVSIRKGSLTFIILWANSADDKLMMFFFLFFPDKRILHFMQIVSNGDNLHEMSNPVFWENKKNSSYVVC